MNATVTDDGCYLKVNGKTHVPLKEARLRLGICRKTAYRWRDKGWLTFVKHEGRIWCPEDQVTPRPAEEGNG